MTAIPRAFYVGAMQAYFQDIVTKQKYTPR
jgi:hypothetical protein